MTTIEQGDELAEQIARFVERWNGETRDGDTLLIARGIRDRFCKPALRQHNGATQVRERVEKAIELRRHLYGGEPLSANERGIVEGIREAVLAALSPSGGMAG